MRRAVMFPQAGATARPLRASSPRGRVVVVGGHSRGVGKTTLIEHLLRERVWPAVTAIKISAHRHAPQGIDVPVIEETFEPSPDTQTGRYLAAGADRAFLARAPYAALAGVAAFIRRHRDEGRTVIVESNRIVQCLRPDLVYFVVDPEIDDWKPSSVLCLVFPHAVLYRRRRDGCWERCDTLLPQLLRAKPRAASGRGVRRVDARERRHLVLGPRDPYGCR